MYDMIPNGLLPHLNEIAARLWSGHAAVMVGAGFSKNATPLNDSCEGFPDWNKLGELFYEKTRGEDIRDGRFLNVLKLADEVQASFGRPMLHQLLRDSIPDDEYEPSSLHMELLNLPWADVLTTNYDTLIERASRTLTEYNYQVVVNSQGLIYSKKPRIIKLHGSFPNYEPFIITEEDYRRYPTDFAPFVNTVQQSLLENTLCLIGFSGDDPNFLRWIGWIRDNLGEGNAPKIYLVGVLNLTGAQVDLLSRYNIVPIDMSEIDDIGASEHSKGIKRFFEFCKSKKSESENLNWPKGVGYIYPKEGKKETDGESISRILPAWKSQRENYPDWIVVPEDRRRQLWYDTRNWEGKVKDFKKVDINVLTDFFYEYLWRLEKCLCPIFDPNAQVLEYILDCGVASLEIDDFRKDLTSQLPRVNVSNLRDKCSFIQLSYLRYLREEGKIEDWLFNEKRASELVTQPNDISRLNYERCLFSLFEVNSTALEENLKKWKVVPSQPFWAAKKAGLLAEIGDLEESIQLLERSLESVRYKINSKPITSNYSDVSQESYILMLLRYVKDAIYLRDSNYSERVDYKDEWLSLKQYKCDPWNELRLLESPLQSKYSKSKSSNVEEDFDLGRKKGKVYAFGDNSNALDSFSLLKFCEDIGLPFRIENVSFAKTAALGAIERLSDIAPYWCISVMLRLGDSKAVSKKFDRETLIRTSNSDVNSITRNFVRVFDDNVRNTDIQFSSRSKLIKQIIPELLSRLISKSSSEEFLLIFEVLEFIVNSSDGESYSGLGDFTRRFVEALSESNLFEYLPRLIDFPIGSTDFIYELRNVANPFRYMHHIRTDFLNIPEGYKFDDSKVNSMLEAIVSGSNGEREWCIMTLYHLKRFGLLSEIQVRKFIKGVWSNIDENGFPKNTGFYFFGISKDLSEDESVFFEFSTKALLKDYILNQNIVTQDDSESGISLGGGRVSLCHEIVGASEFIAWSVEEAITLVDKLIDWWDREKYLFDAHPSDLGNVEVRARFSNLNDTLVSISKFLPQSVNYDFTDLQRVVQEMVDYDMPVSSIKASYSHVLMNWNDDLHGIISSEYLDTREDFVSDAIEGIYALICNCFKGESLNGNILLLVNSSMMLRDKFRIIKCLFFLIRVVSNYPSVYESYFENSALSMLIYLRKETESHKDFESAEEMLFIRETAAKLAFSLYQFYLEKDVEVPSTVCDWKSVCNNCEEFIEIRNSWPNAQLSA